MPASPPPTGAASALIAVVSGLASAGLVVSAEAGSMARLLMFALAPLPLFAGGLSAGALTSLAAGLVGAVLHLAALEVPHRLITRGGGEGGGVEGEGEEGSG